MSRFRSRMTLAEFGGGILLGLLLAFGGGFIAARLLGSGMGFDRIAQSLGGLMIGYPLGSALGPILIGRRFGSGGSVAGALIGSLFGVVFVVILAEPFDLNRYLPLLAGLFFLFPPLFATLAYHAFDRR